MTASHMLQPPAQHRAKTAAVVVADFYADIAAALLASCTEALTAAGVYSEVHRVPGALEVPPALARLAGAAEAAATAQMAAGAEMEEAMAAAEAVSYHCFVALGCVIRGETYHFEVVANTCATGILQVQMQHGAAIGNGVLTVDTREQALARTDKGAAAAAAALALAQVQPQPHR